MISKARENVGIICSLRKNDARGSLPIDFVYFLSLCPFYRLQCVLDGCMGADRGVIPAICLVRPTPTDQAGPCQTSLVWPPDWVIIIILIIIIIIIVNIILIVLTILNIRPTPTNSAGPCQTSRPGHQIGSSSS